MTRIVKVAATQMSCSSDLLENIKKAELLVRQAAGQGAQIILLQELFETPYFCQTEKEAFYAYASRVEVNPAINHFKKIAKELAVVLPISFYEKKNNAKYNSIAIIDADGEVLGVYRKSHIPDGPGYEEKFYFNPGDTGFKVWDTAYGRIGVGICWDQWFPEAARAMVLMGAEILLYPTAIGSEPQASLVDSKDHWQRCMIGHSACNMVPVVASNRIGKEVQETSEITFYGASFITDGIGEKIAEANRIDETVLIAEFDLELMEKKRAEWGLFRDRRPDLYQVLLTQDGGVK
ncbi:MAG: N-carbamoylputrescine amidase [Vallitaleaceae bacterium]|nr:N-carbamoylputrescine amidase [Vallitaleaceae bacterium]